MDLEKKRLKLFFLFVNLNFENDYILYFIKENWKYDWGGLLHLVKNKKVKTILPKSNRLILINHSLGMNHWVTPTNIWAKEDRCTLTGFCIDKDSPLPDTWTSREDYSVS